MTPALLAAVDRAVAAVLELRGPADATLRRLFATDRRLGRRDRGVIAETVFDVLRHRRRYAHLAQGMRGALPQRLARLSLASRLGVPALQAAGGADGDVRAALERALSVDPACLAQAVRLSLPDWLHEALRAECGSAQALEALGQSLLAPAPLDLRVNTLKTDRETLLQALHAAGIEAEALAEPATAIRVRGHPALERLAAFEAGWFEVQDAGSQRLVAFAAPRRGQTVVDFCAGAGGKALALAAAMRSTGQVYACDVSAARLQRLKPRLARSGATSVQPMGLDSEHDPKLARLAARADLVLVDAPCSGTGTLRRNPELKWRLQPDALAELNATQQSILAAAGRLVKPGGALVYATCSLLARENESVAAAFSRARPGFGAPVFLHLRPDIDQCDGFFAARWIRND